MPGRKFRQDNRAKNSKSLKFWLQGKEHLQRSPEVIDAFSLLKRTLLLLRSISEPYLFKLVVKGPPRRAQHALSRS